MLETLALIVAMMLLVGIPLLYEWIVHSVHPWPLYIWAAFMIWLILSESKRKKKKETRDEN